MVLKNRTQNNFTLISNTVFFDQNLNLKDRGLLCTLCALPDGWNFSISGLCAILPDGKWSIENSIKRLEESGYLRRKKFHDGLGRFTSEIEVFMEPQISPDPDEKMDSIDDIYLDNTGDNNRDMESSFPPVTGFPSRVSRHGEPVTDNPPEYNTNNIKRTINYNFDDLSIIHSLFNIKCDPSAVRLKERNEGMTDESQSYARLLSDSVELERLLRDAEGDGEFGMQMVCRVFNVICDMVIYSREKVRIKGVDYPWEKIRSQFLHLTYDDVAHVISKLKTRKKRIKNIEAYIVSALYTEGSQRELNRLSVLEPAVSDAGNDICSSRISAAYDIPTKRSLLAAFCANPSNKELRDKIIGLYPETKDLFYPDGEISAALSE